MSEKLANVAVTIRDERTEGANTAERIGDAFLLVNQDKADEENDKGLVVRTSNIAKLVFNATSIVSQPELNISQCIQNLEIIDPSGQHDFYLLQQGYSTEAQKTIFYFQRVKDGLIFRFEEKQKGLGVQPYSYTQYDVTFNFIFDWEKYNELFTNRYAPYIEATKPELQHYLVKKSVYIDSEKMFSNTLSSKNLLSTSFFNSNNEKIIRCIEGFNLYTIDNVVEYQFAQIGFTSSNKFIFYLKNTHTNAIVHFEFPEVTERVGGISIFNKTVGSETLDIVFNWDKYNTYFLADIYRPVENQFIYVVPRSATYLQDIKTDIKTNSLNVDINKLSARNLLSNSVLNDANKNIIDCIERVSLKTENEQIPFNFLQMGYTKSKILLFYFNNTKTNQVYHFEFSGITEVQSGIIAYTKTVGKVTLDIVFNWDKYIKLFTTDIYRPIGTDYIYIMSEIKESTEIIKPITYQNLGTVVSAKKGGRALLVGASFASPLNGWFELSCDRLGLVNTNKAIGGHVIFNNVVDRMLDANESQPHGSLFMVDGVDVFKDVEVFTLMMTHDVDVFLDESLFKQYDLAYYKANGVNGNHAMAWDYIIKQYKQWCAEYTFDNPMFGGGTTYHADVSGAKECNIIVCSHWLPSRTTFNESSKKLAERFNLSYCDFAKNIGVSKTDSVYCYTTTDANNTPHYGNYNPSVLYAQFSEANPTRAIGKTQVIDGITWGWHMQMRSKTFDFGNGKDVDDYYYPNIQYILSGIYQKHIQVV